MDKSGTKSAASHLLMFRKINVKTGNRRGGDWRKKMMTRGKFLLWQLLWWLHQGKHDVLEDEEKPQRKKPRKPRYFEKGKWVENKNSICATLLIYINHPKLLFLNPEWICSFNIRTEDAMEIFITFLKAQGAASVIHCYVNIQYFLHTYREHSVGLSIPIVLVAMDHAS